MHALWAHVRKRIFKRDADLIRKPRADAVGKARRVIRFMRHNGDMLSPRRHHNGHRNEPALGKHQGRLYFPHNPARLKHAAQHAERVCEILPGKIPAQFAGRNNMIGNVLPLGDDCALDPIGRTDVMHLHALRKKLGHERQVRRHMPGGTAARKDDFLVHAKALPINYALRFHTMHKSKISISFDAARSK